MSPNKLFVTPRYLQPGFLEGSYHSDQVVVQSCAWFEVGNAVLVADIAHGFDFHIELQVVVPEIDSDGVDFVIREVCNLGEHVPSAVDHPVLGPALVLHRSVCEVQRVVLEVNVE